jgi:LPPG:FO 2-phospho-L-lactate transferase
VITILAGGVGGARFADGVVQAVGAERVTVVVNTADDFELYGLRICPDIDTVLYTFAGLADPVQGWGIAGDTRNTLDGISTFGEEPWFQLGDRDIATHILRSAWLRDGRPLGEVIDRLRQSLGVATPILPMSDELVATMIDTPHGRLAFQDYFVRRRQRDEVTGVRFEGIDSAVATPAALEAIRSAELVLLAPSNPIVSIGPILAVVGYRDAIGDTNAPVMAVSPIIGGKALKGPADRMLASLGHESSALGVARIYAGLIDGFVIDSADQDQTAAIEALGIRVLATDAIMHDVPDRGRLAREVLAFGQSLKVKAPA